MAYPWVHVEVMEVDWLLLFGVFTAGFILGAWLGFYMGSKREV